MQTIIESKLKLENIGKKAWTSSTVLIPDELIDYYKTRCLFFNKQRNYFQHLIQIYGRYLDRYDNFPYSKKWKKKYQEKGQGLSDFHFVPDPADWEELRHLSFAYGPSMCHLFVILLTLEKARWENAGFPAEFCEEPPKLSRNISKKGKKSRHSAYTQKNNRNSGIQIPKNVEKTLENLLNLNFKTILHRSIDFDELELLRIGWVLR